MFKVPKIVAIILTILVISASIYLLASKHIQLSNGERVTSLISLFVCWGVLISAIFVVYSYLQTNFAFIESQRPSLLIQVESVRQKSSSRPKSFTPITIIHYKNTTKNEFKDLTLNITVSIASRKRNISNLFSKKMFMAGSDARYGRFKTLSFLSKRGIDANTETRAGKPVVLMTGYNYTFNNKLEKRKGPEYKWDADGQWWRLV